MILEVYQEHNDDLKLKVNKGVAPGTYERHVTSRKHLESYIQDTYNKKDIPLREIDHQFITRYETYLRTKRNCANNTTVKYIKNFGKIIRFALNNDWIRVNPFRNIKYRLEEVDKPYLNLEELNSVTNKTISIQRIAQVRDVFVLCCFTGLAFVDVKSLSQKDIEKHEKKCYHNPETKSCASCKYLRYGAKENPKKPGHYDEEFQSCRMGLDVKFRQLKTNCNSQELRLESDDVMDSNFTFQGPYFLKAGQSCNIPG